MFKLLQNCIHFSQFSRSVVSESLRLNEPQHARPPCPLPTPKVHLNLSPLSQWYHSTILSSAVPFSFCPQSFPASQSSPMSQLFTSGGQSIGISASASVLPMNTQDWSPLGCTGWISLQSRDSQESSPIPQFKSISSSVLSFFIIFFAFFPPFIFISWRLITLQYCGFCHTLTWISPGFTSIPHPDPPSHLPLHLIPLALPSAPGLSTWLMHPTWAGDLFHPR